jgi:hypothetical protein
MDGGGILLNVLEGGGVILIIIIIFILLIYLYIVYKIGSLIPSKSNLTNSIKWANGTSFIRS